MEIWKPINLIEGLEEFTDYEVSSYGRVRSLKFNKVKILKHSVHHRDRYLQIGLSSNGKVKTIFIHRLVALAFIPNDNPTEKTEVNHKDEDKTNNNINNLEWITHKDNVNHGTRNERSAKARGKKSNTNNEKLSKKVFCIELNQIFPSTHEASRQLGLAQSNISSCCNGKRNTCGGHHWRYI